MTHIDEQRALCYDCPSRTNCKTCIDLNRSRPAIVRDVERFISEYRGFMACIAGTDASDHFSLREGK